VLWRSELWRCVLQKCGRLLGPCPGCVYFSLVLRMLSKKRTQPNPSLLVSQQPAPVSLRTPLPPPRSCTAGVEVAGAFLIAFDDPSPQLIISRGPH
jgi:hypothetical protein